MTIIKVSTDKPYKPPEPEVGGQVPYKEADVALDLPTPVAISVRKPPSKRQRCAGLATLLLTISCGIITVVLVAGLYLWHQSVGSPGRRGFCGVTFKEGESAARIFSESVHMPSDDAEIIHTPAIGHWKRSRVLHDFTFRKTAIEDIDAGRCFIMDLDMKTVKPPETFWELIVKLKRGDYLPQAEVIRRTMKVDRGPLDVNDLIAFGPYITQNCENHASYTLKTVDEADRILDREPRDEPLIDRKKRSVSSEDILFSSAMYAGGPIAEFDIITAD